MSSRSWGTMIAGDRMAVDREFNSEIEASQFNRQQWGLIMTAVEFEVCEDGPARLVANTDKLPHVMGELDNVGSMTPAGGGAGGDSAGGFVDSIKSSLGVGGDEDEQRREAAEELAGRYADQLQTRLEERGKWDDVRAAAGG